MKQIKLGILFLLCSLPMVAQTREDSLQIVQADWQEQQVAEGIVAKHASFDNLFGKPQQIFILEVNPRKHPLQILDHQGRKLTTEKAREHGAQAAINGTYFDIGKTDRSVCYLAIDGQVIDYTKGTSKDSLLADGAVILKGKKLKIQPWKVSQEKSYKLGKKSVMVCGPLMLQDGKDVYLGENPGSHIPNPNPRSGIAQVSKKKVLLIVVDGRRKGVAGGVTIPQFAFLTRILGAKSALNLDGGGSSVLWSAAQGIMNQPSDGKERTVSNSIIVK